MAKTGCKSRKGVEPVSLLFDILIAVLIIVAVIGLYIAWRQNLLTAPWKVIPPIPVIS